MVMVAFHLKMHQNNIFFLKKKLFLISTHKNDLKIQKNINLKQIKKIKKINFFKNTFKIQKQTGNFENTV